MKELEERIAEEGVVLGDSILKVDSFLNHQVDAVFMARLGQEFARLYEDAGITRVLTIEASGIAPALFTAYALQVPLVFAKKSGSRNIGGALYTARVHSYTYDRDYLIQVSKKYLSAADTVLIVDDFLARGQAVDGLIDIVRAAGASLAGVGICVEKSFQEGGGKLRRKGIRVESLAKIASLQDGKIVFAE